ncbi:MAG: phosphate butyryltransferase, partial [Firmicutes bacterium]|nr:phosphate butyryltransferase [Bacillota bacterium]
MKHISEIYDLIKGVPPKKIAVAMAADKEVLEAVVAAKRKGIVTGLLFGDVGKMEAILKEMGEDPADYELEEAADELEAADKAVMAVSGGKADIVMKGLMNSGNFIRALLNKEHGIRDGQSTLSAMAITEFAVDGEDRVLFITDPGFNTTPDLETKKKILASAIKVMHALGYDEPKVGILSSAETVNPKMVSSTDAAAIDEAAKNGEFGKCLVCGPISL